MRNESNKSFNLDELIRLSNGDKQFIVEMIDAFIETTEEGMIEIEKAIKENDYSTVSAIIHKIASPCRHMGAEALLKCIKEIENCVTGPSKKDNLDKLHAKARNEMRQVIGELKIEIECYRNDK